jgi:hypothetical protein
MLMLALDRHREQRGGRISILDLDLSFPDGGDHHLPG